MKGVSNQGRIFGVSIRLHYSWVLAFGLITAIMVTQFPESYLLWQRIALGLFTSLLFLVAVSIRSLIIGLVAIKRGIPVKRITLFVFGGGADISQESTHPVLELLLAVVGLLSTLLLCGVFYGIYAILFTTSNAVVYVVIQWLAYIFFMLFLFHLVPGFPLDAGVMLRALLWKITNDYDRATRLTSLIGWAIGLLSIAGGILLLILEQQWFNGLTLVGAGWVLQAAAAQSRRRAVLREALQPVKTKDVMTREYPLIDSHATVSQLINEYILATGLSYCLIVNRDKLEGTVTMENVKRVAKRHRGSHLHSIMTPASELKVAHPQQSAASVLGQMDEQEIDYMPVVEDDRIAGIVSRESLERLAQTRRKLKL
jgi:Zn-dependent protease/predicted transcriptional regulator